MKDILDNFAHRILLKAVILFSSFFLGIFLYSNDDLLSYLPAENELKGWSIYKGSLKILKGEQLSEIYDGGYGLYTDFGVDLAINQIYERNESDILNLIIHECQNASDSFSLFSYWKNQLWDDKSCRFEGIENEAFICKNDEDIFSSYFWKGRYFISLGLSLTEAGRNDENDLVYFMKLISEKIEDIEKPKILIENVSEKLFDLKTIIYYFRESSLKRIFFDEILKDKNIPISGFLYGVKLPLLSYKNSAVDVLYFNDKMHCEDFFKKFRGYIEEKKFKKFDNVFLNPIYVKEEIYQYKFKISYSSIENENDSESKNKQKSYLYFFTKNNYIVVTKVICTPSEIKQIISKIHKNLTQ